MEDVSQQIHFSRDTTLKSWRTGHGIAGDISQPSSLNIPASSLFLSFMPYQLTSKFLLSDYTDLQKLPSGSATFLRQCHLEVAYYQSSVYVSLTRPLYQR